MKPMKYKKGMAMLEVLIAMLVFAWALIPLVRLQVASMDATRAGYYKTETAAAAESMMDYLLTDLGAIFKNKWQHIVTVSGENCATIQNPQQKVACKVLNSNNGKFHADGNAVLCVFGKRPTYGPKPTNQKERDQYLISIRAVWYSGKRGSSDGDLTESSCGNDYDSPLPMNLLEKENIDSIKIDMAY